MKGIKIFFDTLIKLTIIFLLEPPFKPVKETETNALLGLRCSPACIRWFSPAHGHHATHMLRNLSRTCQNILISQINNGYLCLFKLHFPFPLFFLLNRFYCGRYTLQKFTDILSCGRFIQVFIAFHCTADHFPKCCSLFEHLPVKSACFIRLNDRPECIRVLTCGNDHIFVQHLLHDESRSGPDHSHSPFFFLPVVKQRIVLTVLPVSVPKALLVLPYTYCMYTGRTALPSQSAPSDS